MTWAIGINGEEVDCLVIEFFSSKHFVNQHCFMTSDAKPMLRPNFPQGVGSCEKLL